MIGRALGLLVVVAVSGVALGLAVARERLEPVSERAAPEPFSVDPGQSLQTVARTLEERGLVRDARALEWLARIRGVAGRLHVGRYELSASQSASEILERLTEGRVLTHQVVLPEGFTAAQIGARLAAAEVVDEQAFGRAVEDAELARSLGIAAPSLEGYLYPETYRLPGGLPAPEVARILVEQFQRAWDEVAPAARERGLEMHEVVTLASIVEKETGVAEERPLIASVFSNRLGRGMRLESDPTVIYGIADFDGNLRRRDLEDGSNPYNTYRHGGLPPGPIASPGIDAMRAVVAPADTDYLYFVSRNDGTHVFSKSYRDHVNAVNRFQRRRIK